MNLEDDYVSIFGKTKKEMENMTVEERSDLVNEKIKIAQAIADHTELLKNDEYAYSFVGSTDIIDFRGYMDSLIESVIDNYEIDSTYVDKLDDMFYNRFNNKTTLIFTTPSIFAIREKVKKNPINVETYSLVKEDEQFKFITYVVDDNPRITRCIDITNDKAKEFFYKSSKNKDRDLIKEIFEIGKIY